VSGWTALGVAALLLLASLMAGRASVSLFTDRAPRPLRTVPHTDVNPYGANFFLQLEAESWKIDKSLELAREAGLGWVKQHFPWEDIELRKGKFFDDRLNKSTWEKYDRIVETARKYNLQIIARLDRPPPWTRQDNRVAEAPPDNFDDYGDFVAAFVERYRADIRYYQIWNEPNIYPEWGDRPVDPAAYTRLLRVAATRARAVDPGVRILAAPLAQTLERSPRNLTELEYLDAMYRAGARDWFDIALANGYGFERPPEDPPDPGVLNFQRILLLREVMERHGDTEKPVWFNEFGWNAAPEDFGSDRLPWRRVPEALQAEWSVRAIQLARSQWAWVGVVNIWYFRQPGNIPPGRADYYFRMVDVGFTPRPLFAAVKRATAGMAIAQPGSYQESHPAVTYQGAWLTRARNLYSGHQAIASNIEGDNATITFRGTGVHIIISRDPEAPLMYVTLDGREANRLPRDREGRSYADLFSASTRPRDLLTIAQGLADTEHVVRLTVGRGTAPPGRAPHLVLDGFIVEGGTGNDLLDLLTLYGPAAAAVLLASVGLRLLLRRPASA